MVRHKMTSSAHRRVFPILTLCFFTTLMETDIYVPCFPDMVKAFGVMEAEIQGVVSYNFLGFCIACLLYGPLSDSYGRKPIMVAGNTLFAVASLGCVMAATLPEMCIWRFIQGFGAASILSVGSAIFFDAFEEQRAVKMVGHINFIIGLVMAAAPILGSWLNEVYGWRSTFIVILGLAICCALSLMFLFKETLPIERRQPLNLRTIGKDYIRLITSTRFVFNNVGVCVLIGNLIVYSASLSLIFINHLQVSPHIYGWYQGSVLATFALGSVLSGKIVEIFGTRPVCHFGTVGSLIGLATLYAFSTLFPQNVLGMTLIASVTAFVYALPIGAMAALIMNTYPEIRGSAGSIHATIRMLLMAGLVMIASVRFDGTMATLAKTLVGFNVVSVLLYFIAYYQEKRSQVPQHPIKQGA